MSEKALVNKMKVTIAKIYGPYVQKNKANPAHNIKESEHVQTNITAVEKDSDGNTILIKIKKINTTGWKVGDVIILRGEELPNPSGGGTYCTFRSDGYVNQGVAYYTANGKCNITNNTADNEDRVIGTGVLYPSDIQSGSPSGSPSGSSNSEQRTIEECVAECVMVHQATANAFGAIVKRAIEHGVSPDTAFTNVCTYARGVLAGNSGKFNLVSGTVSNNDDFADSEEIDNG